MSQKIHSQDSNFDLSAEDKKLLELGPQPWLPHEVIRYQELKKSIDAYREAAAIDDFLFGDYDYIRTWNNQESNDVY